MKVSLREVITESPAMIDGLGEETALYNTAQGEAVKQSLWGELKDTVSQLLILDSVSL